MSDPSLSTATALAILLSALAMTAIVALRYLLSSGAFALATRLRHPGLYRGRGAQMRREIGWSLASAAIYGLPAGIVAWGWQAHGWTRIYGDIDARPFWYLPVSLLLYLLLHDAFFYWTHRLLHRPRWFRLAHAVHHESRPPTAWAAMSFHPIEAVTGAIVVPALVFLIPIHVAVLGLVLAIMTVMGIGNHMGWEMFPRALVHGPAGRWLITATHHQRHHAAYRGNYGLYFRFWDKACGTDIGLGDLALPPAKTADVTTFSSHMAAIADRWPKGLALLLGLVSATGFAPLGLWPLTLLAFAGWMMFVARSQRGRDALGIGWAFGVGHFTLGLNWIATAFTYQAAMPAWLGWVAVLLLALYLAAYPALAAWGAWILTVAPAKAGAAVGLRNGDGARPIAAPAFAGATLSFILAFAALWTLTEWLRSWVFTGFAWNPLGVFLVPISLASPAEIVGTYGLSGLALLWIGWGLRLAPKWLATFRGSLADGTFISAIILGPIAFFGAPVLFAIVMNMSEAEFARMGATTPITIVQPNIGQADKWEGSKADANFAKLARLTMPKDDTPRLILWPEAAIPDYLEAGYPPVYYDRSPAEARGRLTGLMNPHDLMLLGALKLELDPTGGVVGARNAVMTVRADGSLGPRYDKAHLVPYGEYLPMRPLLSAIGLSRLAPGDIDFWPGPGARTIDLGAFGKAGLQICYEIIFSGQVVDAKHRPDFLFNPSNDAWFGAWGPPQHLAQARLRAIEEGLPIVRATPTGISAVIDADGRVLESIPMHRAGRIDTHIPRAHAPTPFARYGNYLSVGFALLLLALAIAFRRRGR